MKRLSLTPLFIPIAMIPSFSSAVTTSEGYLLEGEIAVSRRSVSGGVARDYSIQTLQSGDRLAVRLQGANTDEVVVLGVNGSADARKITSRYWCKLSTHPENEPAELQCLGRVAVSEGSIGLSPSVILGVPAISAYRMDFWKDQTPPPASKTNEDGSVDLTVCTPFDYPVRFKSAADEAAFIPSSCNSYTVRGPVLEQFKEEIGRDQQRTAAAMLAMQSRYTGSVSQELALPSEGAYVEYTAAGSQTPRETLTFRTTKAEKAHEEFDAVVARWTAGLEEQTRPPAN